MDRIEKVLKKMDKDIDDGEIDNIRQCLNSSLGIQESYWQNQIDIATTCFSKEIENIYQSQTEEIINRMYDDLAKIDEATTSLNYLQKIRDHIFADVPKVSRVKGFKHAEG